MNPMYICVEYNCEWKKVDNDIWEWSESSLSPGVIFDRSIKFLELVSRIYEGMCIDQNVYGIKITHKVVDDRYRDCTNVYLQWFRCQGCFVLQENENLINVHTILKENRDKWEKEFVDDDDEISNDYMWNWVLWGRFPWSLLWL